MRYKEKVISNLDAVANQLGSLKNMIENNNINKELLTATLTNLHKRLEDISEMVSLEDTDFNTVRNGVK